MVSWSGLTFALARFRAALRHDGLPGRRTRMLVTGPVLHRQWPPATRTSVKAQVRSRLASPGCHATPLMNQSIAELGASRTGPAEPISPGCSARGPSSGEMRTNW